MDRVEFDTLAGVREAMLGFAAEVVARRGRQLVLVDPDFMAWPLDDAAWLEALSAFVHLPGRRVQLIGRSFDEVQRARPRFVAWRRAHAHAVQPLSPSDDAAALPTVMLLDRSRALRVLDPRRGRARIDSEETSLNRLADEVDALAQRCESTFAATVLGL